MVEPQGDGVVLVLAVGSQEEEVAIMPAMPVMAVVVVLTTHLALMCLTKEAYEKGTDKL